MSPRAHIQRWELLNTGSGTESLHKPRIIRRPSWCKLYSGASLDGIWEHAPFLVRALKAGLCLTKKTKRRSDLSVRLLPLFHAVTTNIWLPKTIAASPMTYFTLRAILYFTVFKKRIITFSSDLWIFFLIQNQLLVAPPSFLAFPLVGIFIVHTHAPHTVYTTQWNSAEVNTHLRLDCVKTSCSFREGFLSCNPLRDFNPKSFLFQNT